MLKNFNIFDRDLNKLENKKLLISTINAYSYNLTRIDDVFKEALLKSDVLIPDGVSIVWASKFLFRKKITKIAGADLFYYEMNRLEKIKGSCFFLGSTDAILLKIQSKANMEFPNVKIGFYSPPYKAVFSEEDNDGMLQSVNNFNPDVLFVGMTAPKQEKWAYTNFPKLHAGHICSIGAVFDFYAGTIGRAPRWMINLGLEWFYRLIKEPKRMWKRYIIGNTKFICSVLIQKISAK